MLRWKIISIFLLMLLGAVYFYFSGQIDEINKRPHFAPWEKKYVDKSVDRFRTFNNNASLEDAQRLSYAVAITMEDEVCVEMKPVEGVAGLPIVYCWDQKTENLTRYFPKDLDL